MFESQLSTFVFFIILIVVVIIIKKTCLLMVFVPQALFVTQGEIFQKISRIANSGPKARIGVVFGGGRDGPCLAIQWLGNKVVSLLSTIDNANVKTQATR